MQKKGIKENTTMCRTCLRLIEEWSGCSRHDIFSTPDLAKKLITCTSLAVNAQDGFPQYTCGSCYQRINEFHAFQRMCVESERRFRELMKLETRTEFEDEKPIDLKLEEITITESEIISQYEGHADSKEYDVDIFDGLTSIRKSEGISYALRSTETSNTGSVGFGKTREELRSTCIGDARCRDIQSRHIITSAKSVDSEIDSKRDEREAREQTDGTKDQEQKGKVRSLKFKLATKKPKVYQCDACPMRFFVEHCLIAHKRSHDGLVPYPCSYAGCTKGFNRWNCLNEHLKDHKGTNQFYICTEDGCGKRYKHKATLKMHMRTSHKKGAEPQKHICEICGKVFKSSSILNDHRYTHKDKSELPYACIEDNCGRRFSTKDKLKVHGMRHAGIKNYVCAYCGMRKTTRNELKIHMNYHTLERTWPCRFCTHVCNSAGNLKMHVRTVHERAKDYACRFCERSFAKPDTRKYHEMTHTGEKPHECSECGKRFTQPAALRTHKKIHLKIATHTNAVTAANTAHVPK